MQLLFLIIYPLFVVSINESIIQSSDHSHNVAILIQTSNFYHNYRHTANVLSIYRTLKQHGKYEDEDIILMIADDIACDVRNSHPGAIYIDGSPKPMTMLGDETLSDPANTIKNKHEGDNLYVNTQIDYGGNDVTVENFIRVLTGIHYKHTPLNQRITLHSHSNILIYITGHGGDGFVKFRDIEELTTSRLERVFYNMQILNRYREILLIIDTCQAFTLAPNNEIHRHKISFKVEKWLSKLYPLTFSNLDGTVKNVYSIGSSLIGQNSYAHHLDYIIGHYVLDRYVFYFLNFMNKHNRWTNLYRISLKEGLVDALYINKNESLLGINTDVGWRDQGCDRPFHTVPMSDFWICKQHTKKHKRNIEAIHLFDNPILQRNLNTDIISLLLEDSINWMIFFQKNELYQKKYSGIPQHSQYRKFICYLQSEKVEPSLRNIKQYASSTIFYRKIYLLELSKKVKNGMSSTDPIFIAALVFFLVLIWFFCYHRPGLWLFFFKVHNF